MPGVLAATWKCNFESKSKVCAAWKRRPPFKANLEVTFACHDLSVQTQLLRLGLYRTQRLCYEAPTMGKSPHPVVQSKAEAASVTTKWHWWSRRDVKAEFLNETNAIMALIDLSGGLHRASACQSICGSLNKLQNLREEIAKEKNELVRRMPRSRAKQRTVGKKVRILVLRDEEIDRRMRFLVAVRDTSPATEPSDESRSPEESRIQTSVTPSGQSSASVPLPCMRK